MSDRPTNNIEKIGGLVAGSALLGAGLFYLIGLASYKGFDQFFGIGGMVERDFSSVAAEGAANAGLALILVIIAFAFIVCFDVALIWISRRFFGRPVDSPPRWYARPLRLSTVDDVIFFLITMSFGLLVATTAGMVFGNYKAQQSVIWMHRNCSGCLSYSIADQTVLGVPLAANDTILAILKKNGSVQLVKWDDVEEINSERFNRKKPR